MEKNIFILLFCVLLAISNSQIPKQNSNLKSLRRLEESEETILLGFSDYQYGVNPDNKINSIFKTHFLLKNWNDSIYNNNDPFENIYINSTVTNQTKYMQNVTYNCSFDQALNNKNYKPYCRITFICQTDLSSFPKKINIYTDFEKEIKLNETKEVTYESTSAKAIKKDITSLKEFTLNGISFLQNASFVTKNENSFIIKGKPLNGIAQSKNVELITLVNGYPKKIPCIVYKNDDSEEEEEDDEDIYFIKTDGESNLANAELKYALFNYTKGDNRMGILDFKEGENSTFIENTYVPKKKKGLSTGAIVAIIIPSCIVLLGVSALVFLLSRKPLPSQPIKNIGNNTIGVASSEAVVHQ